MKLLGSAGAIGLLVGGAAFRGIVGYGDSSLLPVCMGLNRQLIQRHRHHALRSHTSLEYTPVLSVGRRVTGYALRLNKAHTCWSTLRHHQKTHQGRPDKFATGVHFAHSGPEVT
eukprot:2035442-Alexandrium_andersonii.AAC.1